MGRTYGYIRVSSSDQNESRQYMAMYEQGIAEIISSSTNYRAKIFVVLSIELCSDN